MKTHLLQSFVLIFLFLHLIGESQNIYFNNRYNFDAPGIWDGGSNLIESPFDDGYFILGTTGDPLNYNWHRLAIMYINLEGIKQWTKIISDDTTEYFIGNPGSIKQYESNYIVAGGKKRINNTDIKDYMMLYKFNVEWDTIWTKTYGDKITPFDTATLGRQCDINTDGSALIVGEEYYFGASSKTLIIKTDLNGNKLWEKRIGINGMNQGHSVIMTSDGGYAIGYYNYTPGQSESPDPIIYKTDSLGNLEWEKNIGGTLNDYHPMLTLGNDGNIVAGTSICDSMITPSDPMRKTYIVKLNNEGDVLWEKYYGSSVHYNSLLNIRTVENDGYIATGYLVPDFPHKSGWLIKINENGDSLWYRQYDNLLGEDSWNYLYDVIPTKDKGYATCGYVIPYAPDTGSQDAWVLKVDSMGCDTPGCFTTVINEEWLVKGEGELRVWPNPTKNKFEVWSSKFEVKGNKIIWIYNSQGLKVEEISVPDGVESLEVDVSKYTNGLYYLQYLHSNQILETVKIIKN